MSDLPYSLHRLLFFILLCSLIGNKTLAATPVQDDFARTISLSKPAQKIISLSPHLTELVFSAGMGEKLVGVSKHCDYPKAAKNIRPVSDYQTIDFEALALLAADLILVWEASLKPGTLQRLEKFASAVYVSAPEKFSDIADNLKDIGQLTGSIKQAQSQADTFMQQINGMRQKYTHLRQVPVVYLLWLTPPMTISRTHWISKALELCGGTNLYADLPGQTVVLQREALALVHNALILHGTQSFQQNALPRGAQYFNGDSLHRPSLRIGKAVDKLCSVVDAYRGKHYSN